MAVDMGESFLPDIVDGGPHEAEGQARLAKFGTHCQPLQLGKATEEADPDASGRLTTNLADDVGGAEVIAVEFFFIRA